MASRPHSSPLFGAGVHVGARGRGVQCGRGLFAAVRRGVVAPQDLFRIAVGCDVCDSQKQLAYFVRVRLDLGVRA